MIWGTTTSSRADFRDTRKEGQLLDLDSRSVLSGEKAPRLCGKLGDPINVPGKDPIPGTPTAMMVTGLLVGLRRHYLGLRRAY